ncbi:MAG: zinc ribbon domain-containing protein [Clostridia bacterium]|nr:zinc ribbon domain-containing protein [Clostridia bacterium]
MTCPYCGAQQPEETRFCTECGKYIGKPEEESAEQAVPAAVVPAVQAQPAEIKPAPVEPEPESAPAKDSPWATIGTWGWIGILLLLHIPVINVVMVILWSFGVAKKRVKQSFARAVLVLALVALLVMIVSAIVIAHYWGPSIQEMIEKYS